jgi:hypothetical protein
MSCHCSDRRSCDCKQPGQSKQYLPAGEAAFGGGPSQWYKLSTLGYPQNVPLSQRRNGGSTNDPQVIALADSGLVISTEEERQFRVDFQVLLYNTTDPEYSFTAVISLVMDGIFDQTSNTVFAGTTQSVPFNQVTALHGWGSVLVPPGTHTLSLLIANGGSPEPAPITVISWELEASEKPFCCVKTKSARTRRCRRAKRSGHKSRRPRQISSLLRGLEGWMEWAQDWIPRC